MSDKPLDKQLEELERLLQEQKKLVKKIHEDYRWAEAYLHGLEWKIGKVRAERIDE